MPNFLKQYEAELLPLLTIQDPNLETMASVARRLESLQSVFRAVPGCVGFIPFCEAYRLIAQGMASIPKKNAYHKLAELNRLNVIFISYYFRALQQFIQTGTAPLPWKTYFTYCQRPHGAPFLQMILGVNAHINGDLPHALAVAGYADTHDYHLMNQLLEGQVPAVLWFLAFIAGDRVAFGGVVFRRFAREEFHAIVTTWRLEAWLSARALETKTLAPARLTTATEEVGQRLVAILGDGSSFRHIRSDLKEIHALKQLIEEARVGKDLPR